MRKKSVTKEIAERYKNADKDEKKEILDQYVLITGQGFSMKKE